MSPTRREFLKGLGIALASLGMARCTPFRESEDSLRQRLRDCWLRLDWLAEQSRQDGVQGGEAKKELIEGHRAALDGLIASGELDEEVADQIQVAFAAASDHVFDRNWPLRITCYEYVVTATPVVPSTATPTPTVKEAAERQVADHWSDSAARLVQQAELLAEMAGQSGIDADTVELAQQAIERDLFLLTFTPEEREALADRLVELDWRGFLLPPLEQWGTALPPDVVEAARFLVELLLRKA